MSRTVETLWVWQVFVVFVVSSWQDLHFARRHGTCLSAKFRLPRTSQLRLGFLGEHQGHWGNIPGWDDWDAVLVELMVTALQEIHEFSSISVEWEPYGIVNDTQYTGLGNMVALQLGIMNTNLVDFER